MYSPKIKEEYIPVLYQLAKARKKPMTFIVNEIIDEALRRIARKDQTLNCLVSEKEADS